MPDARRQQLMDRLTAARQQGLSWDAIHQSLNNRVEQARKAGISDAAIQQSLGFSSPDELIEATRTEAQQHMAATKPTSWVDVFVNSLTHSSGAALLGIKPVEVQPEGHVQKVAAGVAETLGDVPAMVVGGIAGAVGGGAAGGPGGAYFGAGAGTMALPQLIKSERDRYVSALNSGQVKGPEDFLRIQADVMKDTGEAAAIGIATAGAGKVAGPVLDKMGANKVTRFVGTAAAEGGTMVTAQSALAGQMPKMEDFIDAAVTIGAFHTAVKIGAPGYRAIRTRLAQHYVDTGETPEAAAEHAVHDPVFRAQMLGRPNPQVPPGSSSTAIVLHRGVTAEPEAVEHETHTSKLGQTTIIVNGLVQDPMTGGPMIFGSQREAAKHLTSTGNADLEIATNPNGRGFVIKQNDLAIKTRIERRRAERAAQNTPPSDTFVVPRAVGSFDEALPWVFQHEGGMTVDTGGLTKYGISSKAHPGVDIAHLTKDDAAEIYHREYWRAIDADALPPNMRLAAFDSAVNQGVGQTKAWLKEANGDLNRFMQLRIQDYARLARDPKYAKYAKSWANRIKDLGGGDRLASIVGRGPDNVGKEFSPEDMIALDMEGEGGGGGKKPPSEPLGGPPEDEDPWKHVMSRVAPDEGTDWLGKTKEAFTRIYGELFDPSHPIRKLVDSVTKGDPLDDYHNPELLFRVAENSGTVAQWAIEKQMVDLDGKVTGPSLTDIVSGKSAGQKFSNADTKKFLDGYALAKWAVMMDEQGKATGIDIDKAKAVVADGNAQFEKSFQHLVDWRNGTLKWLGDGGVHAKDKVEKLIKENGSTIPGYRRMDDGSYRPYSTGKSGIWNPIKTAKGSERLVEPILKSLMQDAYIRHELAVNNRALVATADLGIKGNEATQKRAVDINVVSAIDALKEQGIDEDMLASLAKSAGQMIPKDQVPMFRDGKLYGVKFNDPDLTRVLRGYDQSGRRMFMKIIAAVTSIPRNLQTRFNPLFPVRLLAYDLPWQFIINPDSKGPYSGFLLGLGHMTSDSETYSAWLRSGGAERVFADRSKESFVKRIMSGYEDQSLASNMWNVAKFPFDKLTAWTQMVSSPLRLGRYAKGLATGESPLRATVASSEAAFHRPGYGGPVGKAWNTIVPYTTAHLNGMEKSVRAVFGIGRTVTGAKYNAGATIAKAIAVLTIPMAAQWFAYKDEDWYKAMPEWQKDTALFIVPPIGGAPAIPIAAPPILSELFVALPRRLLEAFVADNPHAADGIWATLGAGLAPPGALTSASILTPLVEHVANYSFHRGRPLVNPDTVRGVQPAEQFTPYTSQAAKDLAQFMSDWPLLGKLSPAVIDNYIAQWGGTMGRTAANAAAAVLDHSSNPPVEQKVADWPGISSWVVRYPSATAEPIQQFYDEMTKLQQMRGSLAKQMREGNFDAFKRIVDRGGPSAAAWNQDIDLGDNVPQGVDLSPYYNYLTQAAAGADYGNIDLAKQAAEALKNARDYSWSVYENHEMSGHDKRQHLDMANGQMQVIAERGNEALDRALIGVKRRGAAAHAQVPDSIYFEEPQ